MPAKFSFFTVAALPIIPIALACGGDDGGGAKITPKPDANIVDSAPVVCTADSMYATPGSANQFAGEEGTTNGSDYRVFWGGIYGMGKPDLLQLTLRNGFGAFSGGAITPATIQLEGAELDFSMCGACMLLFTDLYRDQQGMIQITDYYLPSQGTVTLTSTTDTIEGTIANLMLEHYVVSGQELVPANDGCMVSVPSITMNAMIEPPMGSGSGSGSAFGKPGVADGPLSIRFKLGNRTF
jgi:hypothetical protein